MNHWLYRVRSDSLLKDTIQGCVYQETQFTRGLFADLITRIPIAQVKYVPRGQADDRNYKSISGKLEFKIRVESMNLNLLPPLYNFHILSIRLHINIHSIGICVKP